MYVNKSKEPIYHVFTNNTDEFEPIDKAKELFDLWKKEQGCARLYTTEWNAKEGIFDDVDCIESFGAWPN